MEKNSKLLKLKAEVMWAYLHTRNELSDSYQVDLCKLSDSAVKALSDIGIKAKHKESQGFYITCKSKKFPIEAQYPDGSRIPESVLVGNGSKVTAVVSPYVWNFKNKQGVSASLHKLYVMDLVEYVQRGSDDNAVDVDGDLESDIL